MTFMATAVAVTAVTGLYGAYSSYQAGQAAADNIETQAEQDRLNAQAQMERDSAAESRVVSKERAENRRRRAAIEASYAKSGVLLEGSAADVLTEQRKVDETNVQNIHIQGGNQRALNQAQAEGNYRSSLYAAGATRSATTANLFSNILNTGTSALGAYGAFSRPGVGGTPTTKNSSFTSSFQSGSAPLPSSNLGKANPNIWFK